MSAVASVATIDGARALASSTPSALPAHAAIAQNIPGGFVTKSSPQMRGATQSPDASIPRAAIARRPSSSAKSARE